MNIWERDISRRDFLKLCGALASMAALSACGVRPKVDATPEEDYYIPSPSATPTVTWTRITPELTATPTLPSPNTTPTVISPPPEVIPTPYNKTEKTETALAKTIKKLIKPFWENSQQKRNQIIEDEKKRNVQEWTHRVDQDLNKNRVNFLLFGYGDSYEPPNPNKIKVGSHTIISINKDTGEIDIISFTHDIWDPGIDKYLGKFGQPNSANKIDQAFFAGQQKGGNEEGFRLMGKEIEEMTGLSMDYQIAFRDDDVMENLIDNVFGELEINIPQAFEVQGYYFQGKKKDPGKFEKGPQKFSGERVSQFIKTVPRVEGAYDKSLEHNARKALVFEALMKAAFQKKDDNGFRFRVLAFLGLDFVKGNILHTMPPSLALDAVKAVFDDKELSNTPGKDNVQMPSFRSETYVVDQAHGSGGVTWIMADAGEDLSMGKTANPITRKLVDDGVFPSRIDAWGKLAVDMEIPLNANPYGDLVDAYWFSTRKLVKETLMEKRSFLQQFIPVAFSRRIFVSRLSDSNR